MASAITARDIRDKALAFGYDDCGIIAVSDLREYADRVAERLDLFPEMRKPFGPLADLAFPDKNLPWVKSVVVCAVWYGRYRVPANLVGRIGKSYLTDMRPEPRSAGHQAGLRLEAFLREEGLEVANGRVLALRRGLVPFRWAAFKAGLGVMRRNNFLYTERGSWVWFEAWLIDAEMELKLTPAIEPCPEGCDLCREACPTGALSGPFAMNATKCISPRTTTQGVRADDPLAGRFGGWIFGCDVCQDVCPHNRGAWTEDEEFPGLAELAEGLSPEAIVSADYAWLREKVARQLFYIVPDDFWKWKANALNALRNEWSETYRPAVEQVRRDEHEPVRALAEAILAERPAP